MLGRRGLFSSIVGLVAFPAIVKAKNIMALSARKTSNIVTYKIVNGEIIGVEFLNSRFLSNHLQGMLRLNRPKRAAI